METQEPASHWSDRSSSPTKYCCADCGRSDETVQFVSYPYVFSLLVVTFRRAFTGLWCGRHRLYYGSLACLITSIFGWFGIPWGFLFTPVALYQLARGGIKDSEANARILFELGQEKLNRGDRKGAIRCLEESLRFNDQESTRDDLKSLYNYRSLVPESEPKVIWHFAVTLALPFTLYLAGIFIGLFDYGIGTFLGSFVGDEWNILIVILSWIPLALSLFIAILVLRKLMEWSVRATKATVIAPVAIFLTLYTCVLLYAVPCGEAIGRLIQYIFYGVQFNPLTDFVFTLPPLVTRGGLYYLSEAITSGELWGTIYLFILLGFGILSLMVSIPLLKNIVQWQKTLKEISVGEGDTVKISSVGAWSAVAIFSVCFLILYWLFPQKSSVDFLAASDHYFAGLSWMDTEKFDLAAVEFEQAVELRPGDVNARLGLGYSYYYQEDYITASEIFTDGLETNPDSFELLEGAGWAYFQLNDRDLARRDFEASLKIYPDSPGSHLGLGWIYLQENPESSVNEFNIVLSQIPDQANAHLGLGVAYYLLQDYERALEELQIAAKDDLSKSPAYLALGNLYLMEREYELALDSYKQALTIVPDDYDAHIGLVQAYMALDEYEKAILTTKTAISLQPDNPIGFIYLSGIYSSQGEFQKGLSEIEKALRINSENKMSRAMKSSILYRMGEEEAALAELKHADKIEAVDYQSEYMVAAAFSGMHRYEDAISRLKAAIQFLPGGSDVDYYTSLAEFYSGLGQYAEAQKAIEAAMGLDATNPAIYVAQAMLQIDQENLNSAEEQFQKALDLDPEDDQAHAGLSFVYFQLGKSKQAVREAELAIQYAQYSRWGYESLAFSSHALGRLDEAMNAAKEAVRLDPTRNLSHYILGVCYMEKGMKDEAIQEFEKFLYYYYDRAYVRDYKRSAEEYLATLNALP